MAPSIRRPADVGPALLAGSAAYLLRVATPRRGLTAGLAGVLATILVPFLLGHLGCIAPPAPRTIPASGIAGQPRASMTSERQRGDNPFKDVYWVIDPESNAHRTAEQWRARRPNDAAALDKIAGQPAAAWIGNWSNPVQVEVDRLVWPITRAGGLPVMIVYNLPYRDCGSYSAGGAGSVEAYRRWIGGVADGIGNRRAVVILEPDGLPMLTKCLTATRQRERVEMVRFAVETLMALPGVAVYIDAGHSKWVSPEEIAPRLKAAGIDRADGFALNVSNYQATDTELAYGRALSARLGGKHFVIDTSRNGNGPPTGVPPDDERAWCNPDGRALGTPPTTRTGEPLCDAFLWLKRPGESDGRCNKGPAAGMWWPQKALEMARNAGAGGAGPPYETPPTRDGSGSARQAISPAVKARLRSAE
jgi:endoglucanase